MDIRFQHSPAETGGMDTAALRTHFLLQQIMQPGCINLTYSHYDRVIIGGAVPSGSVLTLPLPGELKADYFLERRELGIINVGGSGKVVTDTGSYSLERLECLYLGKGTKDVSFASDDMNAPAMFYLMSAPAHHTYPNRMMTRADASPVNLGDMYTSNKRTIYKYIHKDGIRSCQLVLGITVLEPGSVWNSVPPHTHTRRMEVYYYFDVHEDHRVMHFMGEPQQTRHLVMANNEAVISPPWSMHFGVGTSSYGFIWGMAGENQEFTDMDPVPVRDIR